MPAELVTLVLQAVAATAPSSALLLGAASFVVLAGTLLLCYEHSRRHTYITVLQAIPPGTLLLDRTQRHKELLVVRLPQSRLIRRSQSIDFESPER